MGGFLPKKNDGGEPMRTSPNRSEQLFGPEKENCWTKATECFSKQKQNTISVKEEGKKFHDEIRQRGPRGEEEQFGTGN